jgi:hypothetical protein
LVFSDALTTYLCTPDLSDEGNPITRMVGWKGIIIFAIVYALVAIFLYLKGNLYLENYWRQKKKNIPIKKKRKLLHYLVLVLVCSIYIHLLQVIFAVSNNILGILENITAGEYHFLNEFAIQYQNFYKQFFISYNNDVYSMFHTIILSLLAIVGIYIAIRRIKKLKRLYVNNMEPRSV